MLNLRIICITFILSGAASSKPTDYSVPNSKLYDVFNSNNPDHSLIEKFLQTNAQPVVVYPLGSYNIYFPLTQDDEDYGDYTNIDYAEEDFDNIHDDHNELFDAIVVDNPELFNLLPHVQYSVGQSSNELSKRDTTKEDNPANDLMAIDTHPKLKNACNSDLDKKPVHANGTVTNNTNKSVTESTTKSAVEIEKAKNETIVSAKNESTVPLQSASEENNLDQSKPTLVLLQNEIVKDNDSSNVVADETNTREQDGKTENIKNNTHLFVSNLLENVNERGKNITKIVTSANPDRDNNDDTFEMFLSKFNHSSTIYSKQVGTGQRHNLKLDNDVNEQSGDSIWPNLFIQKIISFFVQKSLVGTTNNVASYRGLRGNFQANLRISQNKNNGNYLRNVGKIRGDVGNVGFI